MQLVLGMGLLISGMGIAACGVTIDVPDGALSCESDSDCPGGYSCESSDGKLACYRTPDVVGGGDGDSGDGDSGDGDSGDGDMASGDGDMAAGDGDMAAGDGDMAAGDGDMASGDGDLTMDAGPGDGDLGDGDGTMDAGTDAGTDAGGDGDGGVMDTGMPDSGDGDANNPPVIDNLSINPTAVMPGATVAATCTASDPDNDLDTVTLSVDQGSLDAANNWTLPFAPVDAKLFCQATDAMGNVDNDELVVTIPNPPPMVTNVGANPRLLQLAATAHSDVNCTAVDPNMTPLLFDWTADTGSFADPQASSTTWNPTDIGDATLRCLASDAINNSQPQTTMVRVVPDGLLAYYPFQKDLIDVGPNGLKGEPFTISPQFVTGANGDPEVFAAAFGMPQAGTGIFPAVIVQDDTDILVPSPGFTIVFWLYVDPNWDTGKVAMVLGKGLHYAITLKRPSDTNAKADIVLNRTAALTTYTHTASLFEFGKFVHVAVSTASGAAQFYLDGSQVTTSTTSGIGLKLTTAPLIVGTDKDGGQPFLGALDELQFYGRVLTKDEIGALSRMR